MRITNGMMINNTLSHINMNKLNVDKFSTQQSTGKKIQKPSDDPIIAVRALRFRSQLAELNQYLEKNIPDAESWLEVTEEALSGVSGMLSEMQTYMERGAQDTLDLSNRDAVIDTLKQYREQIYRNANADFAGRRIFTGYKTDTDMTFAKDDKNVKYHITEKLTADDFDTISKVLNPIGVSDADVKVYEADKMPNDKTDIHRLRLAYDDLLTKDTLTNEDGSTQTVVPTINITNEDGTLGAAVNIKIISAAADGTYRDENNVEVDPYQPGADDVYFLTNSGEVIFGDTKYQELKEKNLTVSYTKEGFVQGELRPEHYFDCTRYTKENGTTYAEDIVFEAQKQDINYTVNFNQTLKVNTEGKNLFSHDVVRDLDDLIAAVDELSVIEEKLAKVRKMQEDSVYAAEDKQKALASMEEALEKEFALQEDILQKRFERSMGLFEDHQAAMDAEIADVGSRYKRLSLNKLRLTDQQTSVEELKSINEDIDLPETIINLSTASMVYESSLSATSKVIAQSLIDYLQ